MPTRVIIRVALAIAAYLAVFVLLVGGAGPAPALAWLALGVLAAHLLVPQLDLTRRTVARLTPGSPWLALTFDDGPGPYTRDVLEALARHGVQATFFLVGAHARGAPELVRAILAAGHAVGNHGLTHRKLWLAPPREVAHEIEEAQRVLVEAGARPRLFRAPHGYKSLFWGPVLDRQNLRLCAWTRGVWDSDEPPASLIANRVLRGLRGGEILLLHDGPPGSSRAATVAALDLIIPECLRRGFRFITLESGKGRRNADGVPP